MNLFKSLLPVVAMAIPLLSHANTSLTLDSSTKVDMTYGSNSEYAEITTTGTDPHITTLPTGAMHLKDVRLEFYYQASEDVDELQLFFRDPEGEDRSAKFTGIMPKTSEWKFVSINLATYRSKFSWGGSGSMLRMDFGRKSGVNIKIKKLGIYGHVAVSDATKFSQARAIENYLASDFDAKVTNVEVTQDKVIISGTTTTSGCHLAGVTAYGNTFEMTDYEDVGTLPVGNFEVTVDRYSNISGFQYDRLLSKWAIISSSAKPLSHAHYADEVYAIRHAEPGVLKTKKGIGAITTENISEVDNLGLSCTTLNIILNTLVSCTGPDTDLQYVYGGKRYYINGSTLSSLDTVLKQCEAKGVVVAVILLVHPNGGEQEYATALSHPEYTSKGLYSMPDVTNIYGTEVYAATVDFLANRYSRKGNGRIHHWILHNEVDQNLVWTNMGTQPQMRYVDTYEKSMRLVSNIVRQYDPNAYVLGSFTSSWNTAHTDSGSASFTAKNMLDNLLVYSGVEGDYRWGVAAHPYPQDFFKPAFWSADTGATYSEGTGFSTFKNVEVISDWMLRREHYYKGKEKRILFFSENGVNAVNNTSANLNIQAAGAAWIWKKVMRNSGIDGIMWHNWRDNSAEGLQLGLRYENNTPKPSWYVWQAAGTSNEDNVFNKYLSVIGVSSWEQIHHGVSPTGDSSYRIELDQSTKAGLNCSYDGNYQYYTIETTNGDPNIKTKPKDYDLSDNSNVLTFEYQATKAFDFQVFLSTNGLFYEDRSLYSPLPASTEWRRAEINITPLRKQYGWGGAGTNFRFDFGSNSGVTIKVRHMCMTSGLCMAYDKMSVSTAGANQCAVTNDGATGVATVVTSTGGDPFFYSSKLESTLDEDANTLMFEYQASANITDFKAYFVDYAAEVRSVSVGNLAATNTWKKASVDISNLRKTCGWGFEGDYIRLDPGTASGLTFKIRNLCINKGEYGPAEYLTVDNIGAKDLSISRDANFEPIETEVLSGVDLSYNSWYMNTIGSDPYFRTNPLTKNLTDDATKLTFEYTSTVDVEPLELFFLHPESVTRSKKFSGVMPSSSDWKKVVVDFADIRKAYGWGYAGDLLRIDIGNSVSQKICIRNLLVYNGDEGASEVEELKPVDTFSVYGTAGGIMIKSTSKQPFSIFNLYGVRLRRIEVEGSRFVPLTSGMYIVNGKKVIVR